MEVDDKSDPSSVTNTSQGRCEPFLVLRSAFIIVIQTFRHPLRTLRHCARLCSLAPYREVNDESVEEDIPAGELLLSKTIKGDELNNNVTGDLKVAVDGRRKPKPPRTKRIKKQIRKSVHHYGNSSMLLASPIGSTSVARDIQQRISMSNFKYAEMQDVYVPSYGLFL